MTGSSAPDVSVVVVNHRSAEESARCVASLRRAFEAEEIGGEILVVDCGSGVEEARELERIGADRVIVLAENRGYSGGLNRGLAAARGRRFILSNADVEYHAGAVTELLRELDNPRVGVAAPLALWDSGGRLRLPPGFAPGFWRDLAQRTAGAWTSLDDRRFRAWARDALRLWEEGGFVDHLAGAVLATRRDVLDRAGRFDERFPFEYEETEWEERVRGAGFRLRFSPRARVRHFWARSSARSPEAAARRAASEALYRRRRYGALGRLLLDKVPRSSSRPREPLSVPRVAAAPGAFLALSPNASRLPFAAADLSTDFELDPEIASHLSPGSWFFTVFRSDGQPLSTRVWNKAA